MPASVFDSAVVSPRPPRLPFYYGWVNLVMAAVAMTATMPGRTHMLGIITKPLLQDLGMTADRYTWINFWSILIGSSFCLPIGWLLDRFGSRLVLTVVGLALGGATLWMSRVTDAVTLFVALTLVRGLGQSALSVLGMALVGKWFTRQSAMAMGVFALLVSLGAIAAYLAILGAVRAFDDDWRPAWAGVGWVLLAGFAPLAWLLVRNTPEEMGQTRVEDEMEDKAATGSDLGLAQAVRTPIFWVFGLSMALFSLVFTAISLLLQFILEDHNINQATFDLTLGLLTLSGLIANLVGGWLANKKVSLTRMLAFALVVLAAALAGLSAVRTPAHAVLFGLAMGTAGSLITVVFFSVWGQTFGRTNLGKIQGSAQVMTVLTSALGPVLLETCKFFSGSYNPFFLITAPVVFIMALAAWKTPMPRG